MTKVTINVLDRRLRAVETGLRGLSRRVDDAARAIDMIADAVVKPAGACVRAASGNGLRRDRMLFAGGIGVMLAGIALEAFRPQVNDWAVVAIMAVGGALVPHNRIVELVSAWRSRNGRAPEGAPDASAE